MDPEFMSFYDQGITSLPDLPPNLKVLYCHHNNLTSLPPLPDGLEVLWCRDNQITSLPPLPATLIDLDCSDNQITSLPPLPKKLQQLNCSFNQLTTLPFLPYHLQVRITNNNKLPGWYYACTGQEIRTKQIIERLLPIRKKIATRLIQKAWVRYWYYPNSEGISRYSSYMSRVDIMNS